jgi:hypothetical protein
MREVKAWPELGLWGVITLTVVWMVITNLYVDYVVSRDYFDQIVVIGATILQLMYTVWQGKLILNFLKRKLKTKQE